MRYEQLAPILEAILMIVDEPARVTDLSASIGVDEAEVTAALEALRTQYEDDGRGFRLREVGGGWRFYSAAEYHTWVSDFVRGDNTQKLSQAALETLAVVAYRQPISRQKIAAIRGVNVDSVVRSLAARSLIEERGLTATGAVLYGTTTEFLERMGLRDLGELAPLAPHLPTSDEIEQIHDSMEDSPHGRHSR